MQVVEQLSDLKTVLQGWRQAGLTVGFVPTMGNLHAGHLSLVSLAQRHCDKVVVSIFVNPLQFGPNEDFAAYPRTGLLDQAALRSLNTDVLFYPAVTQMYPNGLTQTLVKVPPPLTTVLEGSSRPGHFDGVTTVVTKLFNMVQPDVAVFGQKDFQQLRVIETMVADMALPIKIISGAIARDEDGLALSSRNQYLNAKQRVIAPKLNTVLQDVQMALHAGNTNYTALCAAASAQLLALGFDAVDYLTVCNAQTLQSLKNDATEQEVERVILVVARLGKTRLLDNIVV
ncbi:pantoate--beta-alanine ligase [Thiomicrorhabdus aquaedulcis]|uniref:pantoate--beta-alanine ligase n=1 Tax=Thiomicrorhabdus aquaedulcis TaxID=2211106 RepID=UPI000FDAC9AB|nr:pantoate--beta-alanine ligase [Thiomicrorhabdus aquaedulcis]